MRAPAEPDVCPGHGLVPRACGPSLCHGRFEPICHPGQRTRLLPVRLTCRPGGAFMVQSRFHDLVDVRHAAVDADVLEYGRSIHRTVHGPGPFSEPSPSCPGAPWAACRFWPGLGAQHASFSVALVPPGAPGSGHVQLPCGLRRVRSVDQDGHGEAYAPADAGYLLGIVGYVGRYPLGSY